MTVIIKDGADETKYLDADGAGTGFDPYIMAYVLRMGTASIGKLAANSLVTPVNIGDIDTITHVLDCEKISGLVKGQGTMVNSLPAVIASDQSTIPVKIGAASPQAALTVTNGVYSIDDSVGGLITFPGAVRAVGGISEIKSIKLAGTVPIGYSLMFLSSEITNPTVDNQALGGRLTFGDLGLILGIVSITAGHYTAFPDGLATVSNIGLLAKAGAATTNIYAYLVATETTSPQTIGLKLTVDFQYVD